MKTRDLKFETDFKSKLWTTKKRIQNRPQSELKI